MKTIAAYVLVICLFIWQAIRNGDAWWYGVLAFFGILLMLVIGEKIADLFDGFFSSQPAPRVKKSQRYAQPRLVDNSPNIAVYDVVGEVMEESDAPRLNVVNPLLPSRRIANQKTYHEGDGGFFAAAPMWCDRCKHYPIHFHIDGAWVCQCPWHKD